MQLLADIASQIRDARTGAGMSQAELAMRAGTSQPTLSHYERGRMTPDLETLDRLVRACGRELSIEFRAPRFASSADLDSQPTLAGLADAYSLYEGLAEPDWVRFRGFADYLAAQPWMANLAIAQKPSATDERIENLLAGIAEVEADRNQLRRPRWTQRISGLGTPWSSGGTPSRDKREREGAPVQFLDRGIHFGGWNVWRI